MTGPVPTDNFTQQWILGTATGELRFNHANWTLHMLRFPDGNEAVAPAFPPAPAPTGQSPQFFNISDDDDHDGDGDILARVLAAVRVLPPRPPPPSVEEEPCASSSQRGTSSTVAPPAADTQLASQQQQSATAGSARDKFSPWCELPPAKPDTRTKPHTIGTQQPPVNAFQWFWQQQAARVVTRLEDILVAAFGSTMQHYCYCELCQRTILQPESFVKHVSTDQDHMALVQDMFVHKGPSWRGWVQCWGTVELNHLTLNLSTVAGELRARQIEIGLEVDSAQPPPLLPQPSLEQPTPTARLIHDYPHVPRPPGAPPGREQPTQVRSVAELNHLTLNVSAGELRARGVGLEVDAAQPQPLLPQPQLQQPTEGLIDDYPHTPPPPPGPPPGWPTAGAYGFLDASCGCTRRPR